ncbi:MAG: hypothetical protein U1F63_08310 [Chitinivorax sp.]
MRIPLLCLTLTACVAISACTAQQRYYSAQGWQRNECEKLIEKTEREQCLSRANTSYDDYQKQTASVRKP